MGTGGEKVTKRFPFFRHGIRRGDLSGHRLKRPQPGLTLSPAAPGRCAADLTGRGTATQVRQRVVLRPVSLLVETYALAVFNEKSVKCPPPSDTVPSARKNCQSASLGRPPPERSHHRPRPSGSLRQSTNPDAPASP